MFDGSPKAPTTPAPQGTPAAAVQPVDPVQKPAGALPSSQPPAATPTATPTPGGDIPTPPAQTKPMLDGVAGKDVGNGATRFDLPGKSPLFTNMTDASGMASNQALVNRGAVTAQNQGAMDGIQARQDANDQALRNKSQYDAEVAGAQAINEAGRRMNLEYDLKNGNLQERRAAKAILGSIDAIEKDKRVDATTQRGQNITSRGQELQAGALRQSTQFNQQLARDKFGLEQAKDGRESAASAMDLETKQQLKAAQQEYLNAGDDPVKQKAAERKLMALGNRQGKAPTFHPGSRIKNVDGSETVTPAYVFDPNTGQAQEVGAQGKSQPPAHDIARLQANPSEIAKFESVYGKGSAAQYLGKK